MQIDQPRIVRAPIPLSEVVELARLGFGDMVKAAVDIERGIIALGGELHSDEEAVLIDDGSRQDEIWGINLYPGESGDAWLEFDSMINVRPSRGNRTRGVDDPSVQARIRRVIDALIVR